MGCHTRTQTVKTSSYIDKPIKRVQRSGVCELKGITKSRETRKKEALVSFQAKNGTG